MLVLGDVVDAERAALQRGLADDTLAHLDASAFDLGCVTDLEAHPEFLGAVVDEEDGEDAVVDDGADEVGDAVHQGVEVERGVEGVGEGVQELDLVHGLDADIRGLRGGFFGARPVVPFEAVGWVSFGLWRRRGGLASLFVGCGHGKSR